MTTDEILKALQEAWGTIDVAEDRGVFAVEEGFYGIGRNDDDTWNVVHAREGRSDYGTLVEDHGMTFDEAARTAKNLNSMQNTLEFVLSPRGVVRFTHEFSNGFSSFDAAGKIVIGINSIGYRGLCHDHAGWQSPGGEYEVPGKHPPVFFQESIPEYEVVGEGPFAHMYVSAYPGEWLRAGFSAFIFESATSECKVLFTALETGQWHVRVVRGRHPSSYVSALRRIYIEDLAEMLDLFAGIEEANEDRWRTCMRRRRWEQ